MFAPCTAPTLAARVRVTWMEIIPPFLASYCYFIVAIAVCLGMRAAGQWQTDR